MVDTSVLVAGIAGFKRLEIASQNSSARMLRDWIESSTFIWLITDEIILEYKAVLARLGVRRSTIGRVINLLSEEGEFILSLPRQAFLRIPAMILSAYAPNRARQISW